MGGSGGGGGNAGAVSWPAYLQTAHENLMGDFSTLTNGTYKLDDVLVTALAASPYATPSIYDPEDQVAYGLEAIEYLNNTIQGYDLPNDWRDFIQTNLSDFNTAEGDMPEFMFPENMSPGEIVSNWLDVTGRLVAIAGIKADWESPSLEARANILLDWESVEPQAEDKITAAWQTPDPTADVSVTSDWQDPTIEAPDNIDSGMAAATTIDAAVTAFANRLDDQITNEVLPRFEAGMSDINAVQSSAFVIGRAIIEGMRDRDVANFDAELSSKAYLQRDNLLGQAYLQQDKINAGNVDGKNKILSQTFLDKDKILAGDIDARNKVLAQIYMENDKLAYDNQSSLNKALTQANIDSDKLLAADNDGKNKVISQAYLEGDKIVASDGIEQNKMIAQSYLQNDKLDADSRKAYNLVTAEIFRHGTALAWSGADTMIKNKLGLLEFYKAAAGYQIDASRIWYVMNKEYDDKEQEYDVKDAEWELGCFQYAGNIMASISGGTNYIPGPTPAQNALGGAFAGAAIGSRVTGSAVGAGAGAILGGIGAYLLGQ